MWDIFKSIGVIDNVKQKGSIKNYRKKLHEYHKNEAEVLVDMGLLYLEDENYEESLEHLENAKDIYLSLGEIEAQAFIYDLIGDVYISTRDIDNALENYKISFKLYSSARSHMKSDLLDKINETNDIKEAIELAHEDKIKEEIEKEDSEILNHPNDTNEEIDDLFEETDIAECYLSYMDISPQLELVMKIIKKDYNVKDTSKEEYELGYLQKSIYEAKNEENVKKEVGTLLILVNYLMKENKPYSALQNLKNAFNVAHESGDKKGEAFCLLLLGIVYYILGKEKKIYDVFKKSMLIFKKINCEKEEKLTFEIISIMYDKAECSYIGDIN